MKKFYLFQRLDTLEYYSTYGGDSFWTKNSKEAAKFIEKKDSNFDLYEQEDFQVMDCFFTYIEVMDF